MRVRSAEFQFDNPHPLTPIISRDMPHFFIFFLRDDETYCFSFFFPCQMKVHLKSRENVHFITY